jgi:RNA polymerase sigma-70 factor (ECF subfamily)
VPLFQGGAPGREERLLVRRARGGDQEAARALYDRYFDRIYNYAYARLGRVAEAEDLAIETMTRALTRLDLYEERESGFQSWIYRIAHNATVDYYRRQGKPATVSLEEVETTIPPSADPSELALDRIENEDLRAAIRRLTDDQQQVLLLRFFADLSAVEVARMVGKTVGAVQALQHRALNSLERVLLEVRRR